jgi:hypothetical protein
MAVVPVTPMAVNLCNFENLDADTFCLPRDFARAANSETFGVIDNTNNCVTLGMPTVRVVSTPLDTGEPNFCEDYGTDAMWGDCSTDPLMFSAAGIYLSQADLDDLAQSATWTPVSQDFGDCDYNLSRARYPCIMLSTNGTKKKLPCLYNYPVGEMINLSALLPAKGDQNLASIIENNETPKDRIPWWGILLIILGGVSIVVAAYMYQKSQGKL